MTPREILKDLEDLAVRLGVTIRYERLSDGETEVGSGLFSHKGKKSLLIDQALDIEGRVGVCLREFKLLDLSDVYIKPYLRSLLDDSRGRPNFSQ
ncbi:MAG: hypothetical protein V1816_26365 [Pseudomonadota bacterium]